MPGALSRALLLIAPFVVVSHAATPPLAAGTRLEGTLPRRAQLGFGATEREGALLVARLDSKSTAAAAGLAEGDRIVAVGSKRFDRPDGGRDLLRRLDGETRVVLTIERGAERLEVAFHPPPLPLEQIDGLEIVYGDLTTPDGARLRTVVSRPEGTTGPLPAIFLAQWVSCDGIEPLSPEPFGEVIRVLAKRSGAVLLRVDRSSGGDSEGPACHELDYDTELAHYRFALDALAKRPEVDPKRLVIYGSSLGSTIAPLLAAGRPPQEIAGVAVSGGGALTFFERMLAFDRIGFERGGTPPAEIDAKMRRHAEFLVEYLLRGRDPSAIAAERPELASIWGEMRGTGNGSHYGRPYAWHRQLAKQDLFAAWSRIEAPVLVVSGEFDQFEPPHAHRAAVDLLERIRPGQARWVEVPGMNHFYDVYSDALDANAERNGHPAPLLAAEPILRWLRDVVGFPTRP